MQRLFFVRHGKTELNNKNHVQGSAIDSPLLKESCENAIKTGDALAPFHIKHVISSPQQRSATTAKLITNQFSKQASIYFSKNFKEMDYGDWEGMPISSLPRKDPKLFHQLRHQPEKYNPSSINGETYQELAKRGKEVVKEAIETFPDSDILFVGHSITTTCTILSLLGKDISEFRSSEPLDNTSISVLTYQDSSFSLTVWNHIAHLN